MITYVAVSRGRVVFLLIKCETVMKIAQIKNYPNYFVTQHGEVFKVYGGKEFKITPFYVGSKLMVKLDENQRELIYLIIQAFEIPYAPTDRLKFKVSKNSLAIDISSIKITPIINKVNKLDLDLDEIIHNYDCKVKAESANQRFKEKISPYEIAQIIKSQNHECAYCGKGLDHKNWSPDHFHPKTYGGKNVFENIVASCVRCNVMKHTMHGHEFLVIAERISRCNKIKSIHYEDFIKPKANI